MALKSGFFKSVNGDRKYDATWFAQYFASFIGNGVFPNPSNGLQLYENENMTTVIKDGKGWINGYYLINNGDYVLQHDNADGVLKRIDRIVARWDASLRDVIIVIKKGAFASTPTAPTLQRDADAYELALADVLINNGATAITQANITDQRLNNDLCGIVHSVVEQVDTTTIFNQYQAWFDTWSVQQQQDFESWLATIQDILSGDVAGNLLNLIDEHKADKVAHNFYGIATGTNTLVVTLSPAPTSLVAGFTLRFKNTTANTGAATLNVNGLGAKSIVKSGGTALSAANLKAGGVYTVCYDGSNFILQGEGGEYGTAEAIQVLSGYTVGRESGVVNGTMPNKVGSATVITPSGLEQAIPNGYYGGALTDGKVKPISLTPGDNVLYTSTDQMAMQGTTMNKKLELQITEVGGSIRVKFDVGQAPLTKTANMQIYINGVARGTLRTIGVGGGTPTYSEDFTVNANDYIQVYTSNGSSTGDGNILNLRVCNSFPYAKFNG